MRWFWQKRDRQKANRRSDGLLLIIAIGHVILTGVEKKHGIKNESIKAAGPAGAFFSPQVFCRWLPEGASVGS